MEREPQLKDKEKVIGYAPNHNFRSTNLNFFRTRHKLGLTFVILTLFVCSPIDASNLDAHPVGSSEHQQSGPSSKSKEKDKHTPQDVFGIKNKTTSKYVLAVSDEHVDLRGLWGNLFGAFGRSGLYGITGLVGQSRVKKGVVVGEAGIGVGAYGAYFKNHFRSIVPFIGTTYGISRLGLGISLEPRVGLAVSNSRFHPVGTVSGSITTLEIASMGYTIQFPIGSSRPDWMTTHFVHLSIECPIHLISVVRPFD